MNCSDCHVPLGGQHKISCHRSGLVTSESDYHGRPIAPLSNDLERSDLERSEISYPKSSLGAPISGNVLPDWHTLHEENESLRKALRREQNGSRVLSLAITILGTFAIVESVLLYLHW